MIFPLHFTSFGNGDDPGSFRNDPSPEARRLISAKPGRGERQFPRRYDDPSYLAVV